MKIALISDIHANAIAFQAVLKDLTSQSVDLTVFLGDLSSRGIYPRESLGMLMNIHPLIAIKGNADGKFDEFDDKGNEIKKDNRDEIHRWVENRLTKSDVATIKSFKPQECISDRGIAIGLFHGSPESYGDRIYEDDPPDEILAKFQKTKLHIAAIGHTHVRMRKILPALELINPGAIGISNDGELRAGYGIRTVDKSVGYQQRNIEYPVKRYASEVEKSDIPYKDLLATQIRTGEPNKTLFR